MQHEIRAGDSREAAGELTVLGVLIGKFARVEHGPDLLPVLTVTGPEKLRLTAFNEHLEPQRTVLDRPAGVRILRLFTVAKPQHRESRAAERVAPIFPQIRVVHVVVVEHEAGAVFIHFRGELHLGGDLRMYAREFSRKKAHAVQGGLRLLAPHAEPARAGSQVAEPYRIDSRRAVLEPQLLTLEIIPLRKRRSLPVRKIAALHIGLRKSAPGGESQPPVLCPGHFLDGGLTPQRAAELRRKGPRTEVHQIDLAEGCLHVAAVSAFLQIGARIKIARL